MCVSERVTGSVWGGCVFICEKKKKINKKINKKKKTDAKHLTSQQELNFCTDLIHK